MCAFQCTAVVKRNLCVILRMVPHASASFTQIPSGGRGGGMPIERILPRFCSLRFAGDRRDCGRDLIFMTP